MKRWCSFLRLGKWFIYDSLIHDFTAFFFFAHAVWANIQVTPNIQVLTGQLKYSERWIFFHRKVPLFPFSMLFFLQLIFFHFVHLVHLHTMQLLRWCFPWMINWNFDSWFYGVYSTVLCVQPLVFYSSAAVSILQYWALFLQPKASCVYCLTSWWRRMVNTWDQRWITCIDLQQPFLSFCM